MITGTAADDSLTGTSAAETIEGLDGNDFIRGLGGADTINGGNGNDMTAYDTDATSGGAGTIIVNLSGVSLTYGGVTLLTMQARDGFGAIDTLISIEEARGGAGADYFYGGTGYNWFQGRGGADTYVSNIATRYLDDYHPNGTAAVDYRQDGGTLGININLGTGTGTDTFGATETFTNIVGIRGSMLADTITGDQFYNWFQGLQGNDVINGGVGYDRVEYIRDFQYGGTAGVNVNLITGVAIDGWGNTDTLSNIENVFATNQNDTVTGNAWDNFIIGYSGNDTLIGNEGFDVLRPGLGSDTVNGSDPADQSYADRDTVDYRDLVADGTGLGVIVNLSSSSITVAGYTVAGGRARDTGGSTDVLIDIEGARGSSGADTFRGSDTANLRDERFRGMAGNDTIDGGAGYDWVFYHNEFDAGGTAGIVVNFSGASFSYNGNTIASGTIRDGFGNTDTVTNVEGVRGTEVNDYAVFGASDDWYRHWGGSDFVDGGAGIDTVEFYDDEVEFGMITGAGVTVNLNSGTATLTRDSSTTTLVNIENVEGTYRIDTLTGNGLANRMGGSFGADTINGEGGDDVIAGGQGNDTLNGGSGFDTLNYLFDPTAASYFQLQRANFYVQPNPTGVTVNLTSNTVTDQYGNTDTISGFEKVIGTFLADTITGDGLDNTFVGLSGNDVINGGGGVDTISYENVGGEYAVLVGINASRPNGVTVNLASGSANDSEGGSDTLSAIENVLGSVGNDTISGNGGVNRLDGGDGDDVLFGGDSNDTLIGGNGTDTADYSSISNDLVMDISLVTYTTAYVTGTGVGNDELLGIENLSSGAGNDYLYGNNSANVINAGGGNDYIIAWYGNDTIDTGNGTNFVDASYDNDTVTGGTGLDVIYGGSGNDTLTGNDGNDELHGGLGVDVLTGGEGNDLLFADESDISVTGGNGTDYLISEVSGSVGLNLNIGASSIENVFGSANGDVVNGTGANVSMIMLGYGGADTLTGGNLADYLLGYEGNDVLSGGDGNDVLWGDAGADQLYGGAGTDILYADAQDTIILGGSGQDYLVWNDFSNAANLVIGSAEVEWATGRSGNDSINASGAAVFVELLGDAGNDTLTAGNAGSILLGGAGTDALVGGTGVDHMIGGGDADTFRALTNGGTDYVYDFQDGTDTIDLSLLPGISGIGDITINNTYAAANWYGITYATGTMWVNNGGVGTFGAADFLF